ncbi:MAG: hypothetical protein J0I20_21850 [Chloroflexi bacterium]|nr:hypothetical protein [Chloroflexota bacterium]OJW05391.1 MAG: hypothetical protein BGO39_33910 [Chloroflexi bacterium 54-19]
MKELSRPPGPSQPTPEIPASNAAPGLPVAKISGWKAFWRGLYEVARQEAAYLAKAFGAWPVAALLLFLTFFLALAYQAPLDYSFILGKGNTNDYLYLQSFNPAESNSQFSFRWTTDESYLRFPGVGRLPSAQLQLEMQSGGRPANLPLPKVQVWKDSQMLGEVEVTPGRKFYSFDLRQSGGFKGGDLFLTLKVQNSFKEAGHDLPLGVVMTQVRLLGGSDDGRPVIPSPAHFVFLLAALLAIYLALVRSGWSPWLAAGLGGVFGLGAAVCLAQVRLVFTPVIEELFLTLVLVYPLLVLGLRATGWWLARRKLAIPVEQMRWLGLIFLTAFAVKAVGLNYAGFGVVDHWFRVHQIYRFWNEPASFWQQYYNVSAGTTVTGQEGGSAVLGQWGLQLSLPYSPLFYLFAAPLSFFWPDYHNVNLLAAVNDLATWLEATQIFLLYLVARLAYRTASRATGGGWAGIIAGAIFGFYPLSFLLFSDGGYNSIFAAWLSLLFVALLVDWLRQREAGEKVSRWLVAWLVLSLGAALLAHTSTLLLLGSLLVVYSGVLLLRRTTRPTGKAVGLVTLGGMAVAFVLYYGWYVPGLVGQTLPLLFGKLESGPVGHEAGRLGGPLLSGFWPQLWEHFRFWPFLGLLGFLVWGFLERRRAAGPGVVSGEVTRSDPVNEVTPDVKASSPALTLFWWCWLLIFIVFSVVDLRVNLLQKHMLFVAPLFCLGSGFVVVQLWQLAKGRAGWWRWGLVAIVAALLAFNIVSSLLLWYNRVYLGVSPPGSG